MKHIDEDFVKSIQNKEVLITEKLDGVALIIEKDVHGKVRFFNREKKREIDFIDRLFIKFYDDMLKIFEKKNYNFMFNRSEFHLEYFPKTGKAYLLRYIVRGSENLNIDAFKWIAENLNIEVVPIIYEGKFDGEVETKYLKMFDYKSIQEFPEGIVIIDKWKKEAIKYIIPEFYEKVRQRKNKDKKLKKLKDEYYEKLYDILFHINFNDVKISGVNYLQYMIKNLHNCSWFIDNIKDIDKSFEKYGDKFKIKDFENNYLTNIGYVIFYNEFEFLKDKQWFSDFFRLYLMEFHRKRKRATRFIDRNRLRLIEENREKIYKSIKREI